MSDVLNNASDQNKGRPLHLVTPWDGSETGIVLWVVGPDSETARRSDMAFADELAELADIDGMVTGENRARARLNALARRVIRWDALEDGQPVPFSTKALLTLLQVNWVREQLDYFAGDRRQFGPVA